MNYKSLGLSNINIDDIPFSEAHNIYLKAVAQEYSAEAEGILGLVGNTVKGAYQGTRYGIATAKSGIALAKNAAKKLVEIIKKIIKGFIKMVKNAVIAVLDNTKALSKTIPELKNLQSKLEAIPEADAEQDQKSYDSVTVRDMDIAGWNLSRVNDKSINSTVAKFLKLIVARADGHSPEDLLSQVDSPDTLYDALNQMFLEAHKTFVEDEEMAEYAGWNKTTKRITAKMSGWRSDRQYSYINSGDFGRYVAQANSPAGAFVSTQKYDNIGNRMERSKDFKGAITPRITTNIPGHAAREEFINNTKYMQTLFNFVVSLNVLPKLQEKANKLGKLESIVNRLSNLTEQDVDRLKKKNSDYENNAKSDSNTGKDPNTGNDYYKQSNGSNDYNSRGNSNPTNNNNTREVENNVSFNNNGAESFLPHFILADLDKIKAYSEDEQGGDSYTSAFNQTAKNMVDGNADTEKKTFNQNKTQQTKNNQLNMKETDVDNYVIKYGLNYLSAYLQEAGNVIFQEMKFYATMVSKMHGTARTFIDFANKTYLPSLNGNKKVLNDKNINNEQTEENNDFDKNNPDNK